jgi:hypothetical protein
MSPKSKMKGNYTVSLSRFSSVVTACGVLLALHAANAADAPAKAAAKPAAKAAAAKGKAKPVSAKADPKADLDGSFKVFCTEWGKKLHERELFNVTQIKWDTGQNWVQGTYIGYSEPLSCIIEDNSGPVPVGKIIYHEFVYEKRGGTVPEAQNVAGKAVDTTEVTEIFRYQNGKWIY